MKKIILSLIVASFASVAFAEGEKAVTPPPTDASKMEEGKKMDEAATATPKKKNKKHKKAAAAPADAAAPTPAPTETK
jgi:hypothetical protein